MSNEERYPSESYPNDYKASINMRLWKSAEIRKNETEIAAAISVLKNNKEAIQGLQKKIVASCHAIVDNDLAAGAPEAQELRRCGEELYDLGGFLVMKAVCDSLAKDFVEKKWRTPKGKQYLIGSQCNASWNGIGDWVS